MIFWGLRFWGIWGLGFRDDFLGFEVLGDLGFRA